MPECLKLSGGHSGKTEKAIIRGTDPSLPSRFRQITKISQMARFSNSRSGLEDQGSGEHDKTEAGQGNPVIRID